MSYSIHPQARTTSLVQKEIQSSFQSQQKLVMTFTDTSPSLGDRDGGQSASNSAENLDF